MRFLSFAGNDHFSFQLNTGFFQDRIPDMFDNLNNLRSQLLPC